MRINITIPDRLFICCESDAKAMQLSISAYFRRLAEDRHGVSKLAMQAPMKWADAPAARSEDAEDPNMDEWRQDLLRQVRGEPEK